MNYDTQELEKFTDLATTWWDPQGEMKPLHEINPLRLEWINARCPIENKLILDIGCGGGILAESMAVNGAHVSGLDLSEALIKTAKLHLHESELSIDYHCCSAENFALLHPEKFDMLTCMEMLEHVPDPASIIQACATLVKPGGHIFFSTLNRNLKSYLFSIVGAEYLLRLLPKGTHDYKKFIRPSELEAWARGSNLHCQAMKGLSYNPLNKQYRLSNDIDVNYMMHFIK